MRDDWTCAKCLAMLRHPSMKFYRQWVVDFRHHLYRPATTRSLCYKAYRLQ